MNNTPSIVIIRSILSHQHDKYPPKFICEPTTNKADYIAQIIHQLGYPTVLKHSPASKPEPVRLVSDLRIPIPGLVRICRGKTVQTDLCTNIMQLIPSPESERRLVALLPDYNITFVD